MRAIILAAGIGARLAGRGGGLPKCLLRFAGKSLLQRQLEALQACGVDDVTIVTGYRAGALTGALEGLGGVVAPRVVYNPDYRSGSMVSLWVARADLCRGDGVLLMDADVLFDRRVLQRLLRSPYGNCLLMDRHLEAGEEPVKLCLRDGLPVALGKRVPPGLDWDLRGESVGFFRLSGPIAQELADTVGRFIRAGRGHEPHEEALRELLLCQAPGGFGVEDISGLPWIEIDFPEDVCRAQTEVLPWLS